MTDQPEKLDLKSMDLATEKQAELLRLFPEIRTEGGKIDFDRLELALGETVDVGRERYGLTWPGKADCFKTIQAPSLGTLRPAPEESVNFDITGNLIIEGDNLEVLKLLQKSYLGLVKTIYIDPPYNTGNDFIYPDNFSENLQTYLEYTGQADSQGRKFGTNLESDGRFHSKWLNMIYPRLYLARNLLSPDGVIFISIDDSEATVLRMLCDSVFGEEAFIAQFVWKSRVSEDTRAQSGVSNDHEYILCYGASSATALRGAEKDLSKFSNPDDDKRGAWRSADLTGLATKEARPNLHYDLINPETKLNYGCPPKGWRFEPSTMSKKIVERRILWPSDPSGRPRHKLFVEEMESPFKNLSSVITEFNTGQGTKEIKDIFGEDIIAFPKPSSLIATLVEQTTDREDLVLDFFAGSGTTAHAVLAQNKKDGGKRNFILVQLPEPTARPDYSTIAEITKERVRRVVNKLNHEDAKQLDLDSTAKHDRGFKVYKLAESNFMGWDAGASTDADALGKQLDLSIDHVRQGRTDDDLFYELLLKSGFPLTTPVEKLSLAGKTVFSIGGGVFLICLERELTTEAIKAMADMKPSRVVCLDDGFRGNDQLKSNAVLTFKAKGVAKFQTV